MRSFWLLFPALLASCGAPPHQSAFRATGEVLAFSGGDGGAEAACVTCHGLAGEGDGRLTPRLAGLDAGYLHRQINDYATGRREHAVMRRIARDLNDEDRARLSAYYAQLPAPHTAPMSAANEAPAPGQASAKRLYLQGDPARGLPACATCHGVQGTGVGPANPPLAGQPADYQAQQIRAWRQGKRQNDALKEMQNVSRQLAPDEIAAVSIYAARLKPGPVPDQARSHPVQPHPAPPPVLPGQATSP